MIVFFFLSIVIRVMSYHSSLDVVDRKLKSSLS